MLTGGGSGGHITPILAVADELKKKRREAYLIYIGQTGDSLIDIPKAHDNIDSAYSVRAGKLRRYHGQGLKQIFDIPTTLKNIRDGFFVLIGVWQSYRLLKRIKPDVIFIKGGFVGVPVGLAAAFLKIPYVTHDSDAIPGLANRLISKWAAVHAVAMPKDVYKYPPSKTFEVGVPIGSAYQKVTDALKAEYRKGLGIKDGEKVVCVTGGGLGARRLNDAFVSSLDSLFQKYPGLVVLHIAGRGNEAEVAAAYKKLFADKLSQITVKGFVNDLYKYSAAADIIVCRAGATNLAEFASQQKACIVVPNPYLTGGHQLKNAKHMAESGAIKVVEESKLKSGALADAVKELFDFSQKRRDLEKNIGSFARQDSAEKLAELIFNTAGGNKNEIQK